MDGAIFMEKFDNTNTTPANNGVEAGKMHQPPRPFNADQAILDYLVAETGQEADYLEFEKIRFPSVDYGRYVEPSVTATPLERFKQLMEREQNGPAGHRFWMKVPCSHSDSAHKGGHIIHPLSALQAKQDAYNAALRDHPWVIAKARETGGTVDDIAKDYFVKTLKDVRIDNAQYSIPFLGSMFKIKDAVDAGDLQLLGDGMVSFAVDVASLKVGAAGPIGGAAVRPYVGKVTGAAREFISGAAERPPESAPEPLPEQPSPAGPVLETPADGQLPPAPAAGEGAIVALAEPAETSRAKPATWQVYEELHSRQMLKARNSETGEEITFERVHGTTDRYWNAEAGGQRGPMLEYDESTRELDVPCEVRGGGPCLSRPREERHLSRPFVQHRPDGVEDGVPSQYDYTRPGEDCTGYPQFVLDRRIDDSGLQYQGPTTRFDNVVGGFGEIIIARPYEGAAALRKIDFYTVPYNKTLDGNFFPHGWSRGDPVVPVSIEVDIQIHVFERVHFTTGARFSNEKYAIVRLDGRSKDHLAGGFSFMAPEELVDKRNSYFRVEKLPDWLKRIETKDVYARPAQDETIFQKVYRNDIVYWEEYSSVKHAEISDRAMLVEDGSPVYGEPGVYRLNDGTYWKVFSSQGAADRYRFAWNLAYARKTHWTAETVKFDDGSFAVVVPPLKVPLDLELANNEVFSPEDAAVRVEAAADRPREPSDLAHEFEDDEPAPTSSATADAASQGEPAPGPSKQPAPPRSLFGTTDEAEPAGTATIEGEPATDRPVDTAASDTSGAEATTSAETTPAAPRAVDETAHDGAGAADGDLPDAAQMPSAAPAGEAAPPAPTVTPVSPSPASQAAAPGPSAGPVRGSETAGLATDGRAEEEPRTERLPRSVAMDEARAPSSEAQGPVQASDMLDATPEHVPAIAAQPDGNTWASLTASAPIVFRETPAFRWESAFEPDEPIVPVIGVQPMIVPELAYI
jgi:hypothetical protein